MDGVVKFQELDAPATDFDTPRQLLRWLNDNDVIDLTSHLVILLLTRTMGASAPPHPDVIKTQNI